MDITKLAMIGCGSMGGGMALLFAEKGIHVSLNDPSAQAMDGLLATAKQEGFGDRLSKHDNYQSLCASLGGLEENKVFVWSLPHGGVGDQVLEGLMPLLSRGDVIIDCGNEHWENTERRQGKCVTKGIRYVGCGVSGGYQAARRGPSMCPGSDDETLSLVLPTLQKVAAKTPDGFSCVAKVGTGGAGHYCKMIHNGIEHGMMSAQCEAWGIMTKGLGMTQDEIGDEFERWNASGELRNTFLIRIGAEICRTVDTKTGERVLDTVEDKVIQDYTGEEGTGIWSNTEAIAQHVPAPTLTTAHYLRLASGDLAQRRLARKAFGDRTPAQSLPPSTDRKALCEDLRHAVYAACLAAFVQGMNVIDRADIANHFNISYPNLLAVWRAGCIIQSDHIVRDLLTPLYENNQSNASSQDTVNPLYSPVIAAEMRENLPALKRVVLKGVEADHVVPSLSATLEWAKMMTSTELPTSFYEAQLDYFGKHMFDREGEDGEGRPETGKHHFEWKPA